MLTNIPFSDKFAIVPKQIEVPKKNFILISVGILLKALLSIKRLSFHEGALKIILCNLFLLQFHNVLCFVSYESFGFIIIVKKITNKLYSDNYKYLSNLYQSLNI